ncbi:hypothetical protein D9615_006003 [Tricholomella constricta]|uniref:HECT-like ubiquitin-conjugating enzyme-binding-domain-containing protein n=1 Tax=Tricholomella constricta TaxID=117010 RepID=A0A8H5H9M3_9AGAR|nr:hypothetical protein D9615_006003 [Tricholomella constricta]
MATLTRPKQLSRPASSPLLTSSVPTPFPRDQIVNSQDLGDASTHRADTQAGTSRAAEAEHVQASESHGVLQEVMPSIVHVQKSCLMTLNNLLSMPTRWSPIVPDRRHSMPSTSPGSSTSQHGVTESSSSALQTLVTNLRNQEGADTMIEVHSGSTESELLHELRTRVDNISLSLEPADALLATSLLSLLSHLDRLSTIQSNSTQSFRETPETNAFDIAGPSDLFAVLKRQLSDLQVERLSTQPDILASDAPPVLVVEAALLWSRIDEELEKIVAMCKERTENLPRFSFDSLPPQYDPEDYELDTPPKYHESGVRTSIDSKSRNTPHSPITASRQMDEKMRLDLEGVAMAIDRLYLVAPQLHNQRVELKSSKVAQMERATREGTQTPQSRSGKQNENDGDIQELERMLDLLGKASGRSLSNQSVVLEGGLPGRLERARQKDLAKRDAFVEQLANHSGAGRLHGQDAVLQPRAKDPHALLSLPEFIREAVPPASIRADPQAMLTLPEFVKEPPPARLDDADSEIPEITSHKSKKGLRHRSLSAPSLSWLRSSSSRSGSSSNGSNSTSHSRSRSRGVNALPSVPNVGFDLNYVAENHENLHHVLVFFTVTSATPGVDLEAEVLPPYPESHAEGGDRLIITSGPRASLPLLLPARILPGKQEVRVQSSHYEIKLTTVATGLSAEIANEDHPPLLDAVQLSAANPTSFICASCSLPVVQSTRIEEYRDLPSEHWQELVDAWMCHADQKLHEQVMRHGQGGFWPHAGQALVGGSYILFEESSMTLNNLHLTKEPKKTGVGSYQRLWFWGGAALAEIVDEYEGGGFSVDTKRPRLTIVAARLRLVARSNNSHAYEPGEEWRLARCLCGAVIGRCQDHPVEDKTQTIFRLLKYAIRPVSLNSEPTKIPLSAFIVEDMTEFVRAHATYRFVILDEEDERPRILIWLFKPNIRIAYTTSTPYAIPKSGCIHAAKVLFKILTPTERTADLKS